MKKILLFSIVIVIITAFSTILYLRLNPNHQDTTQTTLSNIEVPTSTEPIKNADIDWTMTAVGDIMLSRNVESTMLKQTLKYDYPYQKIKDNFNSNINFANLETPLIDGPIVPSGSMVFRSAIANAPAMKTAGLNIISLANNHTPNQSQKGLFSTFSTLTDAGIQYVGAGKNVAEAYSPKIMTINNFKVAWLAYNDRDVVPESYGAGLYKNGNDWAGTALMNEANLAAEIKSAREQADYVIVSMHSGTEYTKIPNSHQTEFAHQAIDNGADLVIGHHPHVVQTIEKYKDKYIFYSLGNFVFDQMFSDETRRGLMLKFKFTNTKINSVQLLPITIENYAQPRLGTDSEAKFVLDRLQYPYQNENGYFLNLNQ